MHTQNKNLIDTFYSAFQKRDANAMATCYHPQIQFSDPAFGTLEGDEVKAMWHLLCHTSKDLKVEYHILDLDFEKATVQWQADYIYGKSARQIHNVVKTRLHFKDDKIHRHQDNFSLWRWAIQAMGINGWIIGWTKFFRNRLQEQSRNLLHRYMAKQNF